MSCKRYTDWLKKDAERALLKDTDSARSYAKYIENAKKIKRSKMVYREIYEAPQ